MTRTTMYAAVTLFAAAPAYGGEPPPGSDQSDAATTARHQVKGVAQHGATVHQTSSRRAMDRQAIIEDRSGDRGPGDARRSTERATDEYFRQQQIWTAP